MKVYIVGSNGRCQYADMYKSDGWDIVDNVDDADLVQFTGGEDVTPTLYGCGTHPRTMNSVARDEAEEEIYDACRELNKPMVGICRGGQFLNVMCGGRMYQHVNGHATGDTHKVEDKSSGYICDVTSTHHQMMIPSKHDATVIGRVTPSLCDFKDYVDSEGKIFTVEPDEDQEDVEVVAYPYSRVLCFQPHPEYEAGEACREWFFGLVFGYLFEDWERYNKLTENAAREAEATRYADVVQRMMEGHKPVGDIFVPEFNEDEEPEEEEDW